MNKILCKACAEWAFAHWRGWCSSGTQEWAEKPDLPAVPFVDDQKCSRCHGIDGVPIADVYYRSVHGKFNTGLPDYFKLVIRENDPLNIRNWGSPYSDWWITKRIQLDDLERHDSDVDEGPWQFEESDPFLDAVLDGNVDLIKVLAASGGDLHGIDEYGSTAIAAAIRCGNGQALVALLDIPEVVRVQGVSGFLAAAQSETSTYLNEMLNRGFDPNTTDESNGWSALSNAAFLGTADNVKLLLAAGASINHRDKSGMTPLIHAACRGDEEVCRVLLASGADRTAKDSLGESARDWALENGFDTVAKLVEVYDKPSDAD